MIDFHSHILPCIDDGSGSIEESIALLQTMAEQGIELVCATPHFDALGNSLDAFLERRKHSYRSLLTAIEGAEMPKILLGAEVAYFEGISVASGIRELCLGGTDVLLVEMPMSKWSKNTVNELLELAASDFTVVIAHIERCITYQHKSVISELLANGIIMQANASFFINPKTRKKALKLLHKGVIRLLGTDCHNMTMRPPRASEAVSVISDNLGDEFLREMDAFAASVLLKNKIKA